MAASHNAHRRRKQPLTGAVLPYTVYAMPCNHMHPHPTIDPGIATTRGSYGLKCILQPQPHKQMHTMHEQLLKCQAAGHNSAAQHTVRPHIHVCHAAATAPQQSYISCTPPPSS